MLCGGIKEILDLGICRAVIHYQRFFPTLAAKFSNEHFQPRGEYVRCHPWFLVKFIKCQQSLGILKTPRVRVLPNNQKGMFIHPGHVRTNHYG